MKQKVSLGKSGILTTCLVAALLIASAAWTFALNVPYVAWPFIGIILACCLSAAFYAPVSIEVTDSELLIHRLLKTKRVPLADIRSIERHFPAGAIRTCGAGGFFGNWGRFSERGIGSYFAYFGDPADCFLVRLADGRKYLLGCTNPEAVISVIKS